MKWFIGLLLTAATILFAGCSKYDDSALTGRVDELENRIKTLEELCKRMNTDIASLQTLVTALQNNDYITNVTPVENGYTITFKQAAPITIYNGTNGKDGQNGRDGKDGADGHTPMIGVRADSDGIYYWTLDDEWLTDENGGKIAVHGRDGKDGQDGQNGKDGQDGKDGQNGADGKDGITPQLKIEDGCWFVSTDGGSSWTNLGKATGDNGTNGTNGKDGDSFFQNVDTSNGEFVVFTLSDGTEIKLPTWYAFEQLKNICNQMNTNISSLQTIVAALQNRDYIVSCTPLVDNGVQTGYTIVFAKSDPIIIYHGKNGTDGKDAHSPAISAKKDTDGIYYWTLDDEWLTDENGGKIAVHGRDGKDGQDGQDGIAPQLKIEDGCWFVSTDGGSSWSNLGKATGDNGPNGADGKDGKDGDSFFQEVTQDDDYVYLTLSTTGEKIAVPKHCPFSITFSETEDIRVLSGKTYSIGYTITGADDRTEIKALAQDGFRAVVKKTDNATGTIDITTPNTILPSEVLVFVTDGGERTIMRSINFVEGVIVVTTKSYTVDYSGGTVTVDLSTNIDYTVEIPDEDKSWISVADTRTRAVMRDETLTFTVAANPALSVRYSTIRLVDALGVTSETILITQKSGTSPTIHVATAGTLNQLINSEDKDIIDELTLTGKIDTFDFDFIRTMKNLRKLDLSGLDNETLPVSCLEKSTIPTVLLPMKLTAIPNRAFYQAGIISIYIPETVQSIGDYAFYECTSATGDIAVPDATLTIGEYCFSKSTFDGKLTFGEHLTSIGIYAFAECKQLTGDIIIPDAVTELGERAFYLCSGFNGKVVVGNGVRSVPEYAFYECSGLSGTITLGENIESIGDYAFYKCSNLTGNLVIPDRVTLIKEGAFFELSGLTGSLSIGSSVTDINAKAFTSHKFSRVYCKATTPPTLIYFYPSSAPFCGGNKCTLYVPVGCKASYSSSSWKSDYSFTVIVEMEF